MRPNSYRESTLKRRDALLAAAVELVAERGVEGVTHRDVATRAGLPLATTSYFFGSIDELVHEAVRTVATQLSERLAAFASELDVEAGDSDSVIAVVVPELLRAPDSHVVAQFQTYLRVANHDEWQPEVDLLLGAVQRVAATLLEAARVPATAANVRTVIALVDGFQLQRLAGVSERVVTRDLTAALRSLFANQPTG